MHTFSIDEKVLVPKLIKAANKLKEIAKEWNNAFCFDFDNTTNRGGSTMEELFSFLGIPYNQDMISKFYLKIYLDDNKK